MSRDRPVIEAISSPSDEFPSRARSAVTHHKDLLPGLDGWSSWGTLRIAGRGEELCQNGREIFSQLTGREHEPLQRVDQFAAVIGRRGGKSRAMATLATYIAGLCDHCDALVPGERGVL